MQNKAMAPTKIQPQMVYAHILTMNISREKYVYQNTVHDTIKMLHLSTPEYQI